MDLFLKMKKMKEEYIDLGKSNIEDGQYEKLKEEYLQILANAIEERKQDLSTNAYKKEEIKCKKLTP